MHTYEPDFVIVGSQKCATSWLEFNLSHCENIYMPNRQMNLFQNGDEPRISLKKGLILTAKLEKKQ